MRENTARVRIIFCDLENDGQLYWSQGVFPRKDTSETRKTNGSYEARNNGGIAVNTGKISAEGYYAVVGGDNPIWSEYIYSATNVRLQEAHISYTLPRKWLKSKELTLGVTANNLFMIYRKAPFDPESTASTGTYYQGFDYFMQPSLRTLGFNIKLKL